MATMGAAPCHLVPTMPGGHAATRCGVFTRLGSSAIGRRTPWSRRSRAPTGYYVEQTRPPVRYDKNVRLGARFHTRSSPVGYGETSPAAAGLVCARRPKRYLGLCLSTAPRFGIRPIWLLHLDLPRLVVRDVHRGVATRTRQCGIALQASPSRSRRFRYSPRSDAAGL
jgi:hypothetical protein